MEHLKIVFISTINAWCVYLCISPVTNRQTLHMNQTLKLHFQCIDIGGSYYRLALSITNQSKAQEKMEGEDQEVLVI